MLKRLEELAANTKYPIGDGDHGYIKPSMYQNSGIPYIRVADITWDGKISFDNMTYISEKIHNDNPKSKLYPGDIIIAKTGATIGKVAIIPNEIKTANTTSSVGKITLNSNIAYNRYILRYFQSVEFKKIMWSVSNKSAQPGFNIINLKKFQVPLPPLPEQKRIADTLDKADELRQKRKKAIELLDEYVKSVFYDMFGDPVKNEKGWDIIKLSQIATIERNSIEPQNIQKENIYIGLEDIEKITGKILQKHFCHNIDLKSNKFKFTGKHILYGKLRPYLNKVALPDFSGICSTDILPILPKPNITNKYYLSFILRDSSFVNYANERSSGANLPRVSPSIIQEFSTIRPPFDIQNKFAKIVEQVENTKAKMQESLKEMDNLFNSLMQRAFKGEI